MPLLKIHLRTVLCVLAIMNPPLPLFRPRLVQLVMCVSHAVLSSAAMAMANFPKVTFLSRMRVPVDAPFRACRIKTRALMLYRNALPAPGSAPYDVMTKL